MIRQHATVFGDKRFWEMLLRLILFATVVNIVPERQR